MKKTIISILMAVTVFTFVGCELGDPNYQPPRSNGEFQDDLNSVHDDAYYLEIPELVNDNEITPVTMSLTLATRGENGSTITWTSMDDSIISKEGIIFSHPSGVSVTLIAICEKDKLTASKTFNLLFQ